MPTDLITEWRAIAAQPIRPDEPAGTSARDDADFLTIKDEIQKLESLASEPVNWKDIVSGGRTILGEKSKDLLVASYVSLGLLHQEGWYGLAAGLAALSEVLSRYWESLYPDAKRVQKRIDALVWANEKLQAAVAAKSALPHDLPGIQACEELTRALDAVLVEKLADNAPGFAALRTVLQQQGEKLQSQAKPQPGTEQVQTVAPPQRPTTVTTVEECRTALQEAEALVSRAAAFARSQDPTVAWPYRITRAIVWATIQMPTPLSNGLSRIPPPAPHLVARYKDLQNQGLWSQLVEQIESQYSTLPFWLDPHRFVAQALSQLGGAYRSAKEAVEEEVRSLVRRLPDLPACRFSNDIGFADKDTRQWIDDLRAPKEEWLHPRHDGRSTERQEDARFEELRRQVATLVKQDQAREAVGLLQKESVSVASERQRFLLTLDVARLCMHAGHATIALAQLEALDDRISRFGLHQWEPALCIDVWKTLWQVLQQVHKDAKQPMAEWASRCEAVRRRICQVDIMSAWDMETSRQTATTHR